MKQNVGGPVALACLALPALLYVGWRTLADRAGSDDAPTAVQTPAAPTYTEDSVEYQVACLDADGAASPGDEKTARVGRVLGALHARYPGKTRRDLADMGTMAHEMMAKRGVDEPIVEILEQVEQSDPHAMMRPSDVFGAYVILSTKKD